MSGFTTTSTYWHNLQPRPKMPSRPAIKLDRGVYLLDVGARLPKVDLERGKSPSKWIVRLGLAYIVASQVGGYIGNANIALWFDSRPALLIMLMPRNTVLALTTPHLDATWWYVLGFFRNVLSDPVWFLFGFWYGERAIGWVERRSKTYGPLIREGQGFFRRYAYPLIFVMPNNYICLLSGASGIRLAPFIALNVTGTIARLMVIRQLGFTFSSPLASVSEFIAQYRWQIWGISIVAVAWTVYNEFFRGQGEAQSLAELTREAEAAEARAEDEAKGATSAEADLDEGSGLEVEDSIEPDR